MSMQARVFALVGLFGACLAAVLFMAPIPQDPAYHLFADTRTCLGVPNFADVTSNVGFAAVGAIGLWTVLGPARSHVFTDRADAWPYAVFFAGIALISIGSAYYHAAPDNDRLFWDRLPMTVAFMAFFAGVMADRVGRRIGVRVLLPLFIALGACSLLYWDWTEARGMGDLRFYGLVQFYPIIALPAICWLFPQGRHTNGGDLAWIVVWYVIAKVLEHLDAEIFDLLGNTVSGHSLKHLAAAVATFMVWRMVRRPAEPQERKTS